VDTAWENTAMRVGAQTTMLRQNKLKIASFVAAASLIIAVLTGVLVFRNNYTKTRVGTEVVKQIVLTDGTVVTLNKGAIIEFPRRFSTIKREVKLVEGDAFFSVHKDSSRPFVVTTPHTQITVLGTRFNVSVSNNGDVSVIVESGKVLVTTNENTHQILLEKNESGVFRAQSNTLFKEAVDWNRMGWLTHRFAFRNSELAYVFDILSRAYGITIEADTTIMHYRLTATFEQQSFEEILKVIDRTFYLSSQPMGNNRYRIVNLSSVQNRVK
jgi:ferric-dicitrate binding protein FerR (iron transport regulator)